MVLKTREILANPVWEDVQIEGFANYGTCPEIAPTHMCVYVYSSFPYGLAKAEATWSFDVASLIAELGAVDLSLKSVKFYKRSILTGTSVGESYLKWYTDFIQQGSIHTIYRNLWEQEEIPLNVLLAQAGVPLCSSVGIGLWHRTTSTAGTGELRAHTPILVFDFTSAEPWYDVKIKVFIDGTVLPDATVRIKEATDAQITNLAGEATFSFKAGTYTAIVTKKIEDVTYEGSVTFTVPSQLYAEITLEEKPLIPSWVWWLIGGSAVLVVASVVIPPFIKRRK